MQHYFLSMLVFATSWTRPLQGFVPKPYSCLYCCLNQERVLQHAAASELADIGGAEYLLVFVFALNYCREMAWKTRDLNAG